MKFISTRNLRVILLSLGLLALLAVAAIPARQQGKQTVAGLNKSRNSAAQQQVSFTPIGSTLEIVAPTGECATCPDYVTADKDCQAQEAAYLKSCLLIEGNQHWSSCMDRSNQIYNGCMAAWGCPVFVIF